MERVFSKPSNWREDDSQIEDALLGRIADRALELQARYEHTDENDASLPASREDPSSMLPG